MVTVHIYSKTFLLIKWSHGETYKSQYITDVNKNSVFTELCRNTEHLCFQFSSAVVTTAVFPIVFSFHNNSFKFLSSSAIVLYCCCGVCLELRKTMASASDTNYCNTVSRDLSYGFPYVKVRKLPKSLRIIGSKILTHSIDRGITEGGLWAQFT